VSLLWPNQAAIGLFPGISWMRAGRRMECFDGVASAGSWAPRVFERAIQGLRDSGVKGGSLDVVLSDQIARCAMLPWQEQQLSVSQLQAYARACIERGGANIDAKWAVDAGYRQFRAAGLAVAVPGTLLSELVSIAAGQGMRLRSATPLTSLAYWRHSPGLRRRNSVLFLHEMNRLTMMRWEAGRISALDVQPIARELGSALWRLIQRQPGLSPLRVVVWCVQPGSELPGILAKQFPKASLNVVSDMSKSLR